MKGTAAAAAVGRAPAIALLLAVLIGLAAFSPTPLMAQSAPTPTPVQADLAAFTDGFVPLALKQGDIAGATVSVVRNGEIVFARGYGLADREAGRMVRADNTLFRVGSVSKLFIWVAAMQQVERGRLDLDADIARYIDFNIPDLYDRPITLRHLMTHTAGFGESLTDMMLAEPSDIRSSRDYLAQNVPARVNPSGHVVAYSNYGAYLVAYIVERVSKQDFANYVEAEIFAPLGMNSSSFRQPLPDRLRQRMASGYRQASGAPRDFELLQVAPAGSMSSTAKDMARFMAAMLAGAAGKNHAILEPASARLLLSEQFVHHPATNGMALGFLEEDYAGVRSVGHAGATLLFLTDMHLFPDENIGLFISMNSFGKDAAAVRVQRELYKAFVERYLARPAREAIAIMDAPRHGAIVSGLYETSRRVARGPFSFATLFSQVSVTADDQGVLTISNLVDLSGAPKRWLEVEPFVYRAENGHERVAFTRAQDGELLHFSADDARGVQIFQPVPWWRAQSWNIPLLGFTLAIFALLWLLWPIGALIRKANAVEKVGHGRARMIIRIGALLGLAALGGWLGWMVAALEDLTLLSSANFGWFYLLQLSGWLALAASIVAMVLTVRLWREKLRSVWARPGLDAGPVGVPGFCLAGFYFRPAHSRGRHIER